MTKATCSKCKKIVYLTGLSPEGIEYWSIKDSIKELLDKLKRHKCCRSSMSEQFTCNEQVTG